MFPPPDCNCLQIITLNWIVEYKPTVIVFNAHYLELVEAHTQDTSLVIS